MTVRLIQESGSQSVFHTCTRAIQAAREHLAEERAGGIPLKGVKKLGLRSSQSKRILLEVHCTVLYAEGVRETAEPSNMGDSGAHSHIMKVLIFFNMGAHNTDVES